MKYCKFVLTLVEVKKVCSLWLICTPSVYQPNFFLMFDSRLLCGSVQHFWPLIMLMVEELRNLSQQQGSRWKDLDRCVKHSKNGSKKRLEHLSSAASGDGYHRTCNWACVTETISCWPADYWDVTFMFTIPQSVIGGCHLLRGEISVSD